MNIVDDLRTHAESVRSSLGVSIRKIVCGRDAWNRGDITVCSSKCDGYRYILELMR